MWNTSTFPPIKTIHFRESFPWLGLENIEIIEVIRTPDLPNHCMSMQDKLVKQVRETYRQKPDVYLISCGVFAKYLTVMVKEELNVTGLDIGNVIESMMNVGNKRPFMERFAAYDHIEYNFTIGGHMEITGITKKG